jgi:hypothetical protein
MYRSINRYVMGCRIYDIFTLGYRNNFCLVRARTITRGDGDVLVSVNLIMNITPRNYDDAAVPHVKITHMCTEPYLYEIYQTDFIISHILKN